MRRVLLSILTACIAFPALAAATSGPGVVAPKDKIAGHGYGQWLGLAWQSILQHPANAPACEQTQGVALLLGGPAPIGKYTCTVKANEPLYSIGLSDECSTVEKPPSYAKTPAGLVRCARKRFTGISGGLLSIDGDHAQNLKQYISASPVYPFRLPQNNILGVKKRQGEFAAHGYGFLIRGLSKGLHIIVGGGTIGKQRFKGTFTITAS